MAPNGTDVNTDSFRDIHKTNDTILMKHAQTRRVRVRDCFKEKVKNIIFQPLPTYYNAIM